MTDLNALIERIDEKVLARFWSKVDKAGETECWNWTACLSDTGYGTFVFEGKSWKSHRFSALLSGIPIDNLIRHTCDNPACVNPAHLLPGSFLENLQDMWDRGRQGGLPARNALKKTCKRGHPLSGENLRLKPQGWRECRACEENRKLAIRQRIGEK